MLGGSEVSSLQMAKALVEGGYSVSVICYYESDPVMVERWKKAGVFVVLLNEKRNGLAGLFHLLRVLVNLFRKERPDAVHVQYFSPGMIPILAARLAGIRRVFATVHAAGNRGYGWKSKLMFRISAVLTTHFFCVSENTERFWFGSVGGRHSTIYNGVDLPLFSDAVSAEISGIGEGNVVIGLVGRAVSLKGHDCLFRSAKRLLPELPNLKLLIVGDGPDRLYFENMAEKMGLKERIVWMGRVEPETLPGFYKTMDVLAMPSHWEGFGLTAAEAMASGVPVAGSDVPGLREVVGDAGILFPVDDDAALADAIRRLLAEKEEYGRKSLERVFSLFALADRKAEWKKAYGEILAES